jgi:hypothetical protein
MGHYSSVASVIDTINTINAKELGKESSDKVEAMREIPALIMEQEKAITSLRNACDHLHQKLSPVLSSGEVDAGSQLDSPSLISRESITDYGHVIKNNTESIAESIDHIRELIERLEL